MDYKTLENNYLRVTICNLGSTLARIQVKVENQWIDALVSYKDNDALATDSNYLNAVCGPHAGRIKDATYAIGDDLIHLDVNDRGNNLHCGPLGLDKQMFSFEFCDETQIHLTFHDKNQDVVYQTCYTLIKSKLNIELTAVPVNPTLINMTQHAYFNLGSSDTIQNMTLQILSDGVAKLDASGCPTEQLIEIDGTVFDYNETRSLTNILTGFNTQFLITGNIDHPYSIKQWPITIQNIDANLAVEISSDSEWAVVYMGQSFQTDHELVGDISGEAYSGIAIEPQALPNGINFGDVDQIATADNPFARIISYQFKII